MTTASFDARPCPGLCGAGSAGSTARSAAFALVRGLGCVAIVLAVLAAVGMALDFAIALPMAVRWAIWVGWIAAGTLTLLLAAIRPAGATGGLCRPRRRGRAVAARDGRAAQQRGRIARGEAAPHGSPALIAALADDAAKRASEANLGDAVSGRRAAIALLGGLVAAGLVVAPSLARPDPFATLASRFLMPWADVDRVSRFVVERLARRLRSSPIGLGRARSSRRSARGSGR